MKNKKRILHVLVSNIYSGAENVVCTIIGNMSDEYEMAYCSPEGPIRDSLRDKGVKYFGIKKLNRKNLKKVIDEFNPDIIHAHDITASVVSAYTDKKRIIVSHVHANHDSMRNFNLKTFLYNLFSKRFHKIVWVSKSAFDNYHFYKKICDKSIVLYNVIDSDRVVEKAHEFVSDKKYDLIYVGRLTYQKNPQRLVSVIEKVKKIIPNVKLGIIGNGDLSDEVSNLIKDLDLSDNVEMLGFQKNPFPYMINSKMMIMTSRFEGTPMCALEAIACGVPIISTRTDGLVDIIEDGKTGFLSDEDDVLVKDIIELIQNEDKLKEFKNNVLNANEKLNNLNSFCKKIKDLYL